MPKRRPEKRWNEHVSERYQAFLASKEFLALRRKGLEALSRRKLLTPEEWSKLTWETLESPTFGTFRKECRTTGERFGLNQWTVEMACLLKGYRPQEPGLVVEAKWPDVRIVTKAEDDLFLRWIMYEAWNLGLHVIRRVGSTEVVLIEAPFPSRPEEPLTEARRPAPESAFYVRVETPPLYPPEAAAELHRSAGQAGRELLRRLGYTAPKRLRSSKLLGRTEELRIRKNQLGRRESGDIAEDIYGEGAATDQALRKRVKDSRYKLKRRLKGQDQTDKS